MHAEDDVLDVHVKAFQREVPHAAPYITCASMECQHKSREASQSPFNTSSALQVDYAAGVVHKNIVQLLDVFTEGQRYVIVVRPIKP